MASCARADEGDPGRVQRVNEVRVFRQEAVSRVDRLCAALFADLDDLGDLQIALGDRSRADAVRFVGHRNVFGVCIGVGIDSHGFNAEFAGCFHDPAGDFTTVGNEDFLKHCQMPSVLRSSTTLNRSHTSIISGSKPPLRSK